MVTRRMKKKESKLPSGDTTQSGIYWMQRLRSSFNTPIPAIAIANKIECPL